jgi:predicted alpha-1,2-mannosidase
LVDPFIGTVGSGNTFPGPTLPFGMIQPGPFIKATGENNYGTIYGFSQTHLSGGAGGGSGVAGDIIFMPTVGDSQLMKAPSDDKKEYQSRFTYSNEYASPGYYRVFLDDYKITAELTATLRTGFHKYTFPKTDRADIVLKLGNGALAINGDEISGYNSNHVYFVAKFYKQLKSLGLMNGDKIEDAKSIKGEDIKGFFRFETEKDESILLKVGISMVSVEGARKNLKAEMQGWDFDLVRENAKEEWNKELGKIEVGGGTKSEQIIFYTSLYHSMMHPNINMDVDRKFRSTNGQIYTATDFDNYTTFSLWDTFRATHPLFTITNQERTNQFIKTFMERYDHNGRMLIMEFQGEEGEQPPMIGYHSLSVIADAYVKGIRDYDVPKVYKAMKELADDYIRPEKELYLQYGFIPSDLKGQSVSRTLEYSYDDWCITRLAEDLSQEDNLYYSMRGEFYKNVFSEEVNFMRGRKSNFQMVPDFDPMETINHYTEANAYQYSTFVPQDIEGLIELMGGDEKFEEWLDNCFTTQTDFSKINVRDVTGLIGQYAHGNEPSHHIAYLYNYVGKPWKTQEMVRRILSELYTDKRDGIDGNEDCGQMSAWYVLSAMGFYSVAPGMDYYVIGSPVFDKVTLNLENGNSFEIIAKKSSEKDIYIQSAQLNGQPYPKTYLKHSDIMKGGEIVFEMGDKPNKEWGVEQEDRPYSIKNKFKYAKTPNIDFAGILFMESTTVNISSEEAGAKIYYTLDGSEPTEQSMLYKKPIKITKATVLKTRSFVEGIHPSYPLTVHFKKIDMLGAVHVSGLKPGVKYIYKEGDMMNTRMLKGLPVLETGVLDYFHVDNIKDSRQFGYNLEGYLKVPETGVYTFSLEANDGAVLFINNRMIIDNDGGHRAQKLDTKIGLKKGWHPIKVDYFQQGLAKSLTVIWEGPGVEEQEIPKSVLFHK